MTNEPFIAIVGAGLGGLALAHGLASTGRQVMVFERDAGPESREQGYRISLNGLGVSALAFTFATASMRALLTFRGDAGARTVRRAALRLHLSKNIPVRWGSHVVGIKERSYGVVLRLADGETVTADLVVGADGAASSVREALKSTGAPVPEVLNLGIVSIGGHVDRAGGWDEWLPLNRTGAVQYFGPAGWSLFVSFCEREDRTPTVLWALSRRGSLLDDPGAAAAEAMSHRSWHRELRRLVTGTAAEDLIAPIAIRTSRLPKGTPRSPMSRHGRVTLLGDAAHLMPPQRGLGGNSALEDARVLADALATRPSIPDAVAAYEREMRARTRRAVEESEESAQMFHFRNPVAVGLRSAMLRGANVAQRFKRA